MSEEKRTPGPFCRDGPMLFSRKQGSQLMLARLSVYRGEEPLDELVDLLNKGTHYDGMMTLLKKAHGDYVAAASSARAAADAARSHAERMRYRERLGQLENTAKRFAQVIAQAEPKA